MLRKTAKYIICRATLVPSSEKAVIDVYLQHGRKAENELTCPFSFSCQFAKCDIQYLCVKQKTEENFTFHFKIILIGNVFRLVSLFFAAFAPFNLTKKQMEIK